MATVAPRREPIRIAAPSEKRRKPKKIPVGQRLNSLLRVIDKLETAQVLSIARKNTRSDQLKMLG